MVDRDMSGGGARAQEDAIIDRFSQELNDWLGKQDRTRLREELRDEVLAPIKNFLIIVKDIQSEIRLLTIAQEAKSNEKAALSSENQRMLERLPRSALEMEADQFTEAGQEKLRNPIQVRESDFERAKQALTRTEIPSELREIIKPMLDKLDDWWGDTSLQVSYSLLDLEATQREVARLQELNAKLRKQLGDDATSGDE